MGLKGFALKPQPKLMHNPVVKTMPLFSSRDKLGRARSLQVDLNQQVTRKKEISMHVEHQFHTMEKYEQKCDRFHTPHNLKIGSDRLASLEVIGDRQGWLRQMLRPATSIF